MANLSSFYLIGTISFVSSPSRFLLFVGSSFVAANNFGNISFYHCTSNIEWQTSDAKCEEYSHHFLSSSFQILDCRYYFFHFLYAFNRHPFISFCSSYTFHVSFRSTARALFEVTLFEVCGANFDRFETFHVHSFVRSLIFFFLVIIFYQMKAS